MADYFTKEFHLRFEHAMQLMERLINVAKYTYVHHFSEHFSRSFNTNIFYFFFFLVIAVARSEHRLFLVDPIFSDVLMQA